MNRSTILPLVLFAVLQVSSIAQGNPFFSGNKPAERFSESPYPGFIRAIIGCINDLQRELNGLLGELSRRVNEEKDIAIFFVLFAVALAYGIIHALGPGHGKIIMMSYALANPLKAGQGVLLGTGIAVAHTLSAVVLVSLLFMILHSSYANYAIEPKKIISLVSYGLIGGMGIFLLSRTIMNAVKSNAPGVDPEKGMDYQTKRTRDLFLPALMIGLIPCDGAILILIFSISIGSYWLGIILSAVLSIGMAITISAIGVVAVYSKKGIVTLLSRKKAPARIMIVTVQLFGAAIIIVFGALMFFANLA